MFTFENGPTRVLYVCLSPGCGRLCDRYQPIGTSAPPSMPCDVCGAPMRPQRVTAGVVPDHPTRWSTQFLLTSAAAVGLTLAGARV